MSALASIAKQIIRLIDLFVLWLGRLTSFAAIAMMLTTCTVAFLRYVLDMGSIPMQESITYLHAALFMLGAAYTLQHNGHVRVDIFYRRFSPETQAWINSLGTLIFLLPFCIFIGFISWDFVLGSWAIHETSSQPGGLTILYVLKSLLPLMAFTLGLQGIAELLRNALFLMQQSAERAAHAD